MLLREPKPLLDERTLSWRTAEDLRAVSRVGGDVGEVLGDGVTFGEEEAVGAFEGGDLAEGEFGEVRGGVVVGAEGEGREGEVLVG